MILEQTDDLPADMRDFADAIRRLHGMLSNPHPGLHTWTASVHAVMQQAVDAALALKMPLDLHQGTLSTANPSNTRNVRP